MTVFEALVRLGPCSSRDKELAISGGGIHRSSFRVGNIRSIDASHVFRGIALDL